MFWHRLEVADIFRRHGEAFRATQGSRLAPDQRRVMAAIEVCRTTALGGHVEQCDDCGLVRIARELQPPFQLRLQMRFSAAKYSFRASSCKSAPNVAPIDTGTSL
jgi:hypothetical protein